MLNIKFINPIQRIKGERKSKLLSPHCSLYKFIIINRIILSTKYEITTRPPHIEILRDFEKGNIISFLRRTTILQNKDVPIRLTQIGNALAIPTGYVEGYGLTHVTVAYFPKGFEIRQILSYLNSFN